MSTPGQSHGQQGAGVPTGCGHWEWVGGPAKSDFSLPTLIASQEREAERERLAVTDLHCPLGRRHNEGERQS